MLNSIYIDGYRNLKNLQFDIRPGLNVLLGSNGVGKSNLMEACNFLSKVSRVNLTDIPSIAGENDLLKFFYLGNEFHNISSREFTENPEAIFEHNNVIHFKVEGTSITSCMDISEQQGKSTSKNENSIRLESQYVYDFKIGVENLKFYPLLYLSQSVNFHFSVEGKQVGEINLEFAGPKFSIHQDTHYLNAKIDNKINKKIASLEYLTDTFESKSLLTKLGENFYPIKNILNEMSFAQPLEILPNLIRSESFEITGRSIEYDGRGLFSILANLYQQNNEKFDEIVEHFNVISSDEIGVEIEMTSRKFIKCINVILDRNNGSKSRVPIQQLSDGYLKWFSLVSALLLTDYNIIIDEPENFLDTIMQSEFPRYLRDTRESKKQSCLLTTHSETIINSLKPDEIILVDSPNGFARVRRVEEIDRLKKNMYSSGFQLGWYFHSGSLECYCDTRI